MKATYLPVAETAKLVRAALKKAFPGVKFSVRSESFSMGCAVRIKWTDGPLSGAVERVAKMFEGKRFDGSVDYGWTADLWLLPDGTCTVASDEGSACTGGTRDAQRHWMPHPEAKLVSTGAWVTCSRECSAELVERCRRYIARKGGRGCVEGLERCYSDDEAPYALAHRSAIVGGALVVEKRRY